MSKIKYCEKCGSRLIRQKVGAEEYDDEAFKNSPPAINIGYPTGSEYSEETGERNYIIEYVCPKKNIFNKHSRFTNYEKK